MSTPRSTPGDDPTKKDPLENPEFDAPEEGTEGLGIETTRESISARAKEAMELPSNRTVLDVPIEFCADGKRIETLNRSGAYIVRVNVTRFRSREEAERAGIVQAAYLHSLRDHLQTETGKAFEALQSFGTAAHSALRLKGVKTLGAWEKGEVSFLARSAQTPLTLVQQFDRSVEHYLLTGEMPQNIPNEVRKALEKIPGRQGKSALDFIAQESRSLRSSAKLYEEHIAPLRDNLKAEDGEKRMTERDDYVPPNFKGEQEPLDPESVRWRVEPFVGGYYRQQLYRYDPTVQRIVAEPTEKTEFKLTDPPENIDELALYTFHGVYVPGEENRIPFPEKGLPLPDTLNPKETFMLMRSSAGIFSLEERRQGSVSEPVRYSFQFVIARSSDNRIDDDPTDADLATIDGPLDATAEELTSGLKQNTFLNKADRGRSVVFATRKQFMYPKDEEMSPMDARYRTAGMNLHPEMADLKLADCHWSNIRASDLARRLDVPMRTPSGFFVTRHPDVEFAPIGGIGHAWSERWDEPSQQWIRMDATPPKQDEDQEEDEKEEDQPASAPAAAGERETKVGVNDEESEVEESGVLEMSEQEMEQLLELVTRSGPSVEEVADALFRERTNVSAAEWKKVEGFLETVNASKVPEEAQIPETPDMLRHFRDRITAPKGTLEREWQKLFCLICTHRLIHRRKFPGNVRQSESTTGLENPVDAYIDIMADEPDPMGFGIDTRRPETILDVKAFEEDSLVDLTSSMNDTDNYGNVMRVEQKKVVLSLLHYLMELNTELNDSRVRSQLRTPLKIRSEVYSIHGQGKKNQGQFARLKGADEDITEAALVHLARELDQTTPGAGDFLSALRAYREGLSSETLERIRSGELVKMLTIYSDGNHWCSNCGSESCNVQIHAERVRAAQEEIRAIRDLGIIVQGIGFTKKAEAIKIMCNDPKEPGGAMVVNDVSRAISARHAMLAKHLQKI
jgi:hypothetical protein